MPRRDPAKEQRWRELIETQSTSGLSVRAFCRERNASEHSFHAWRRKLRALDAAPARSATFAEVRVQGAVPASLTLELPGEITIRLPLDVAGETLTNILVAARRADAPAC